MLVVLLVKTKVGYSVGEFFIKICPETDVKHWVCAAGKGRCGTSDVAVYFGK